MARTANRREFMTAAGLAATASTVIAAAQPLAAAADPPSSSSARSMGEKFRALLKKGDPFEAISCPDSVCSRAATLLGFPSMYLGSSAMAEYHGVPDWGLVSFREQLDFFSHIAQAADIPGMADMDSDGDAIAFYRNVKAAERAGIGCLHFADGEGVMGRVTKITPLDEMVDRIHAAVDARSDMCISVRLQGRNIEMLDKTLERAAKYAEAGADVLWIVPMMMEENVKAAAVVKVPLTTQMFIDTPQSKAKENKVTMMVYATFLQNIMQGAMYEALNELKTTGMLTKAAKGQRLGQGIPNDVRAKLFGTTDLTERGKKYHEAQG